MTDFNEDRFAVIADIHSNSDALKAVLADIADLTIDCIVNLGDHLSGPMTARETADLLMAADMIAIRGNHDRWLYDRAREEMYSIDAVARDQLDDTHLDWLRGLPPSARLGSGVFACHGTPKSDTTYWTEKVTPQGDVVLRPHAEIEAEADGLDAGLFLCGHTHLPRRVDLPNGRVILNPGSVGCPAYDDDIPVHHLVQTGTGAACYAIVERTKEGWASQFRHVPYDPARMIACAIEADHLHWESRLATGWIG